MGSLQAFFPSLLRHCKSLRAFEKICSDRTYILYATINLWENHLDILAKHITVLTGMQNIWEKDYKAWSAPRSLTPE